LFARGRLMPEVARAREVLSLMRAGALDGLSIGFRTVKGRTDPKSGVRRLDKIDLWEISIVTFPMLPEARVSTVKRGGLGGVINTARLARSLRRGARLMRAR
jgi:HK97 family phage prohead protease